MPVDLSLLQVGDVLYVWGPRRGVGNTTATHRSVETRTVVAIHPPNERGVTLIDVKDPWGRTLSRLASQLAHEYTPYHPKPERRPFSHDSGYHEREVAVAAEKAAAARKVWAERRKAKRAAEKAAKKDGAR